MNWCFWRGWWLACICSIAVSADAAPVQFVPPHGQTTWMPVQQWTDVEWSCWLSQHHWPEADIQQYLTHDRFAYGFGVTKHGTRAQVEDIGDDTVKWLYQPTPKGVSLHRAPTANTLWGGAAGGTKSFSARWEAIRCCDAREDFRAIMVRREREELRRTHLDKLEREIVRLNAAYGESVVKLVGQPPVLSFARSGSKVVFGHCNNDGDEEKYLSEDYDLFIGDEATRLLTKQIVGIAGRVRNDTKLGLLGRMILTTNPGGPAHDYCVTRFIEKTVPHDEDPKYDPADYTFIRAALYDNPYYMDPDGSYTTYEKRLSAYEPERRRQLLNGDWSAVVGQFFSEFRVDRHVAQIPLNGATKVERWIRWGYGKPGYVCWVAVYPNGRVYVFAEWLFREMVAAKVAIDIIERSNDAIRSLCTAPIAKSLGNVEMWDDGDDEGGESTADTFRRYGLPLTKGSAAEGWQRLRHWFSMAADYEPWLQIHPRCSYAIRTLPFLTADPKDPEELLSENDQVARVLKTGVMARPTPKRLIDAPPPVLPNSVRQMMNDAGLGGLRGRRPIGMVS